MTDADPYLRADRDDAIQALQDILTCIDAGSSLDAVRDRVQGFFARITSRRLGVAPENEKGDDLVQVKMPLKAGIKSWIKRVYAVDQDERSGYAFLGPFLAFGGVVALPNMTVVIHYVQGDHTPDSVVAKLCLVARDDATGLAGMEPVFVGTGKHWASPLKPQCASILSLIAEQKRRERAENAAKAPATLSR